MHLSNYFSRLRRPITSQSKRPLSQSTIATPSVNPLMNTLCEPECFSSINIKGFNRFNTIDKFNSTYYHKPKKPRIKFAHFYKTPIKFNKMYIPFRKSIDFRVEGRSICPSFKGNSMIRSSISSSVFKRCTTPIIPGVHCKYYSIESDDYSIMRKNISVEIKYKSRQSLK